MIPPMPAQDCAQMLDARNVIDLDAAPAAAASAAAESFSAAQARQLRRLPQAADEVWHVALRRLRCFVLPVEGGSLQEWSRPRALIVARLGDPSIVLRCASCAPAPELCGAETAAGTGLSVLEHVARCVSAPRVAEAPSNAPPQLAAAMVEAARPHRPSTVTFEDAALAAGCGAALAAVDVRCVLLRTSAPHVDFFVQKFSEALVQSRVAAATRESMMAPPLPIGPGSSLGVAHVRALLSLSRRFAAAKPWMSLPDKQTFRIRVDGAGSARGAGDPLVAWASVMGFEAIQKRQAVLQKTNGDLGAMMRINLERGVRVFFKRYDAEQRLLSPLPSQERPVPPPAPLADSNFADLSCGHCGRTVHSVAEEIFSRRSTDAADIEAVDEAYEVAKRCFNRCGACKEVYYCVPEPAAASSRAGAGAGAGADAGGAVAVTSKCQKEHWPKHKAFCAANKVPDPSTPGGRPGYWGTRELLCLFQPLQGQPFRNLELFDRAGYTGGAADLPFALTFERGMPRPCSTEELHWVLRAMAAILQFSRQRPDIADDLSRHTDHEEEVSLSGVLPTAVKTLHLVASASTPAAGEPAPAAGPKQRRTALADAIAGGEQAAGSSGGSAAEAAAAAAAEVRVAAAAAHEQPWFEAFGAGPVAPVAHVRPDGILPVEDARNVRAEVFEVASTSHDLNAFKPGLFVPTRASLLCGDRVDAPPGAPEAAGAAAGGGAGAGASRCAIS